jgi:DNA-binding Lrp family transcriptional regulator
MNMSVRGYLLIQTKIGEAKQVVDALGKVDGVVSANVVTRSWDAIAIVAGESIKNIGELVMRKVRKIDSIDKALTCFVV